MSSSTTTRGALLAALIRGPSYGLELIERVGDQTDGAVTLHQGSVYPALRALEEEGLVESYSGDPVPERGGRPRRYYKLTALGAGRADEERRTAARLWRLTLPTLGGQA